jgi:hypothetical protein
MVWWMWKSLERTQILAKSQSYFASEGRKMGFSSPGVWLSWHIEERKHTALEYNFWRTWPQEIPEESKHL